MYVQIDNTSGKRGVEPLRKKTLMEVKCPVSLMENWKNIAGKEDRILKLKEKGALSTTREDRVHTKEKNL